MIKAGVGSVFSAPMPAVYMDGSTVSSLSALRRLFGRSDRHNVLPKLAIQPGPLSRKLR